MYKNSHEVHNSDSSANVDNNSSVASKPRAFVKTSALPPISIMQGNAALLPICLGQEYHKGEKLQALIDFLHQAPKILVLISGSLYRHTIQITDNVSPEVACEKAITEGEDWLSQHKAILDSSRTATTVYRWENWLLHPKYPAIRKQLEENYATDKNFRQSFDDEANKFIERLKRKSTSTLEDTKRALATCLEYLKEECAVFVVIHNVVPYTHFVYPGSFSKAIYATFEKLNPPVFIVQPEFSSRRSNLAVQYTPIEPNIATRIQNIMKADRQDQILTDRIEVLSSCRVYFLKGASLYVREIAANLIKLLIMQSCPDLELYEYNDIKTTSLIFAPKGKYPAEKFYGELSKNYIPSGTIDYKKSFEVTNNSGNIILKNLHDEEAQKWEPIAKDTDKQEFNDIYQAIKFYYSFLVYTGAAPDALIVVGAVPGELYFTNSNNEADEDKLLLTIQAYLVNLDANLLSLAFNKINIAQGTTSRQGIKIINPNNLLRIVFELYMTSVSQKIQSCDTLAPSKNTLLFSKPLSSSAITPKRKQDPDLRTVDAPSKRGLLT